MRKQIKQLKDCKPKNEVTRHFEDILQKSGSIDEEIEKNRDSYGYKE